MFWRALLACGEDSGSERRQCLAMRLTWDGLAGPIWVVVAVMVVTAVIESPGRLLEDRYRLELGNLGCVLGPDAPEVLGTAPSALHPVPFLR